jgi:hypothetical protein
MFLRYLKNYQTLVGHFKMTTKLEYETTGSTATISPVLSLSPSDHYSITRQMINERLKALNAKPLNPQ